MLLASRALCTGSIRQPNEQISNDVPINIFAPQNTDGWEYVEEIQGGVSNFSESEIRTTQDNAILDRGLGTECNKLTFEVPNNINPSSKFQISEKDRIQIQQVKLFWENDFAQKVRMLSNKYDVFEMLDIHQIKSLFTTETISFLEELDILTHNNLIDLLCLNQQSCSTLKSLCFINSISST